MKVPTAEPLTHHDLLILQHYEGFAHRCIRGAHETQDTSHKAGAMIAIDAWFSAVDQVRELYYGRTPGQ